MKHLIPLRIIVTQPLAGVVMKVQKGKDELTPPSTLGNGDLCFDFDITVDLTGGPPNFLGKFAQGPKDARFVYVNSGTYAGQGPTIWGRRAKLPLKGISADQIAEVLAGPGARMETVMPGVGPDGGPTCATVKGIEWKVVAD